MSNGYRARIYPRDTGKTLFLKYCFYCLQWQVGKGEGRIEILLQVFFLTCDHQVSIDSTPSRSWFTDRAGFECGLGS